MAVKLFKWSQLINHRAPEAIQRDLFTRFEPDFLTRLKSDPNADPSTGYFHALEDADSDRMNFDLYPVWVTELPVDPATGKTFSGPEGLLTYMRLNFNTFLAPSLAQVFPYTPHRDTGTLDEAKWKSASPAGTVMTFDIKVNWLPDPQASVVATLVEPKRWIFSPWKTPKDANHPVSGNREFGFMNGAFRPDAPTEFEPDLSMRPGQGFYIRACDRVTSALVPEDDAFNGAVQLWTAWQQLFKDWVVLHGGKADIVTHIQGFEPWASAKKSFFAPKTRRLHPPQTEVLPF